MTRSNKSNEWYRRAINRAIQFRRKLRKIVSDCENYGFPCAVESAAAVELTGWIQHLRERRGPPAPAMPWLGLLTAEEELAADLKIAEFKEAQKR